MADLTSTDKQQYQLSTKANSMQKKMLTSSMDCQSLNSDSGAVETNGLAFAGHISEQSQIHFTLSETGDLPDMTTEAL
ncbi:unnamed protein product [Gongylonema pulchrum]|uniref:Uncharacterized protein n=1 Tax=Gongylonema pulchrum TaxID=637853 RepID=A0A183DI96_9BILA|nr:unnamed protein product [Gongylonema pulchrum]